ncbi:MAG: GNAT family N-acetyltransferase [Candidatus Lokiarchaeota archaeon]|nr:GNAT family N-acetyltransferase [Candidatus Lokiarchaeota archaeon]
MRIDTVTVKDLGEIYNLERKFFKKDAFSKELILNLIIKNFFFFKLIDNEISNDIVGFIVLIQDREGRVNLINLLIKKGDQNKGYGTYLLNYTMSKVKEMHKIKTIVLNVNSKNKVAIKLYQKFNFRIVQKIENYYRQKESAYLMILNI